MVKYRWGFCPVLRTLFPVLPATAPSTLDEPVTAPDVRNAPGVSDGFTARSPALCSAMKSSGEIRGLIGPKLTVVRPLKMSAVTD